MTISTLILLLVALNVKHYIADYVLQSTELVQLKKTHFQYLLLHSLHHGLATFLVFLFFGPFIVAVAFAVADFILHTLIDSSKTYIPYFDRFKPPSQAYFNVLGLDQLLHNLCYVLFAYLFYNNLF